MLPRVVLSPHVQPLSFAMLCALVFLATPHHQEARADAHLDIESALADFDHAQQIHAERPERARQLFQASAQKFAAVVAAGVVNGHLEFNLANAYLQSDDVGRAILHYRRAERMIPGDARLAKNLKTARSRRLTTVRPSQRSAFLRGILFWHFDTTTRKRVGAAIVLYVLFWLFASARRLTGRAAWLAAAVVCAFLAVVLAVSAGADRWSDRHAPEGVVTAMDVVVYQGYDTSYERQFEQPLQSGVEFTLRQRHGDWWFIELPDGESGWIDARQAELIPTGGL